MVAKLDEETIESLLIQKDDDELGDELDFAKSNSKYIENLINIEKKIVNEKRYNYSRSLKPNETADKENRNESAVRSLLKKALKNFFSLIMKKVFMKIKMFQITLTHWEGEKEANL